MGMSHNPLHYYAACECFTSVTEPQNWSRFSRPSRGYHHAARRMR